MSSYAEGNMSRRNAVQRAKEVCRFLKLLPEASNMPISVVVNFFSAKDHFDLRLAVNSKALENFILSTNNG